MNANVSIPHSVFKSAEKMAKKLGLTLSEFYTEALVTYIDTNRKDSVKHKLNKIYEKEASYLDPITLKIQLSSLEKEDW